MSTTFGMPRPVITKDIILENEMLPAGFIESDFIPAVYRSNNGKCKFLIDTYDMPDSTKIYPLDNTAQGLYTFGDVRDKITSQQDIE